MKATTEFNRCGFWRAVAPGGFGDKRPSRAALLTVLISLLFAIPANAQGLLNIGRDDDFDPAPSFYTGFDAGVNLSALDFQAGGAGLTDDEDGDSGPVASVGGTISARTPSNNGDFSHIFGASGRVFLNDQSALLETDILTAGPETTVEFMRQFYFMLFTGLRYEDVFGNGANGGTPVSFTGVVGARIERSRLLTSVIQGGNDFSAEETDTYLAGTAGFELGVPLDSVLGNGGSPFGDGAEFVLGAYLHQVPGQDLETQALTNVRTRVPGHVDLRFLAGVQIPLN